LKILVNAISARFGGIVTYTSNLMRSLDARGVDATFAISRQFPTEPQIKTLRFGASQYPALARLLWEQTVWRRDVAKHAPDVLFSSANFALFGSPVPQVLLLREGGLFDPFYLTNVAPTQGLKGTLMRNLRRTTMLLSAHRADRIITPTETMRQLLLNWSPRLSGKIFVNPYGTLARSFLPAHQPRAWRENGELRLLYVSVYYPHKNPGVLARATEALNQSGERTATTITMTLDELEAIRGSALDLLLLRRASERGIVTLGHHDYGMLPSLYQGHDIFVFPSVSETFGHPMVEAMSCGLPVLAADTAVNREVCGDAALYFDPFSAGSLMERIRQLDAIPELRLELGDRARKRILNLFTWDAHVDRLLDIFEDVRRTAATRENAP